jgi:hypothetical protein
MEESLKHICKSRLHCLHIIPILFKKNNFCKAVKTNLRVRSSHRLIQRERYCLDVPNSSPDVDKEPSMIRKNPKLKAPRK